jgi:hypothetical protein
MKIYFKQNIENYKRRLWLSKTIQQSFVVEMISHILDTVVKKSYLTLNGSTLTGHMLYRVMLKSPI